MTVAQLTFVATHTGTAIFTLGEGTILARKDSGSRSITPVLSDDDEGNSVTILPKGTPYHSCGHRAGTVECSEWSTDAWVVPAFHADEGYGLGSVTVETDDQKPVYFDFWNESGNKPGFSRPNEDVTLTATFTRLVSVAVPGVVAGGSITGSSTQAAIGTRYTVTVANQRGYGLTDEGLYYTTPESTAHVAITRRNESDTRLYYFYRSGGVVCYGSTEHLKLCLSLT